MSCVLKLENLSKSFGAVVVADETCLELTKGEALGIIGPNGAGKTSLFNLITGTLNSDGGSVIFDGVDVTKMNAAKRCRSGMARSFQIPQPFSGLTVFENAMVAATQGAGLSGSNAENHCLEILDKTGLLEKANTVSGSLTLLERKRLELTRALCVKPKLLLLDEIAGGLTEQECVSLVNTIQRIHKDGMSIIWIEHVVHALLAVVDKLMVVDFGKKIAEGNPKEIMASDIVQEIYLGIDASE